MRRASFKKTDGVFFLEYARRMNAAASTPTPIPTRELMGVNKANASAKTPMHSAGTKIFMPMLR